MEQPDTTHLSWCKAIDDSQFESVLQKLGWSVEELASQEFDPETQTIGGYSDVSLAFYNSAANLNWSFLLLPFRSQSGHLLGRELSLLSQTKPVVVYYECGDSDWGFSIYKGGLLVGKFFSDPESIGSDPSEYSITAKEVAGCFSVSEEEIAPYLERMEFDDDFDSDPAKFDAFMKQMEERGKAHPDDEFELDNHWVRCDFMKRLGMSYDGPGTEGGRYICISG